MDNVTVNIEVQKQVTVDLAVQKVANVNVQIPSLAEIDIDTTGMKIVTYYDFIFEEI